MAQPIRIKMHGKEKYVALSGNMINKSSIKAAFLLPDDAIVNLSYESNGKQINCGMNEAGTTYLLPDGWSTMEFFAESNRAPSRPAFVERPMSPYYPSLPPDPAPTAEAFFKWMFFLKDHFGKATVICVHPRYFVSFRHGSHLQLKLGDTLKMYTADSEMDEQHGIDVTVVKVDESLDFILLKSEYNVVERGPSIARAEESAPFTLAGYGNEHGGLSYLYGTIHSVRDHYFNRGGRELGPFILGNSPSPRGDSGDAIWGSRGLIGMNAGSTTMPLQFHHLAISEAAATFSVKIRISPALRFKEALMKELQKERIAEKAASPPQKKPCYTTQFEGLGTFFEYSD